jgi:hypothetical protein
VTSVAVLCIAGIHARMASTFAAGGVTSARAGCSGPRIVGNQTSTELIDQLLDERATAPDFPACGAPRRGQEAE